jgi:aminoglycoside phosphotransferase (APT) family kinase protein
VSTLVDSGRFEDESGTWHYLITEYLPGTDLFSSLAALNEDQQERIGLEFVRFLGKLHSITGSYRDIGHYIPTIPRYHGSWIEGHQEYLGLLERHIDEVVLCPDSVETIAKSFSFIRSHIGSLEYQCGPVPLHNDLHPRNIIVHDGCLSGVIDWECSQFGEPDFDLTHLVHWSLFPPMEVMSGENH